MLFFRKSLIFSLCIVIFGLTACSTKQQGVSDKEYMRSNNASEKALEKLDRE